MEAILNRHKIDLNLKNEPILITNLLVHEMEVEIECGVSLLNKSIILVFSGEENEEFRWPFDLTELKMKRMSDFGFSEHPWLIRELIIESNGCENNTVYLSIYKSDANFISH